MQTKRRHVLGRFGALAVAVAVAMGGSTAVISGAPPGPQRPAWIAELERSADGQRMPGQGKASLGSGGTKTGAKTVPDTRSIAMAPAPFAYPEPAAWEVGPGLASPATGRPVRLAALSAAVKVEVLDRKAATRLGTSGFVFTVSGAKQTVELTVDYSSFAKAYGADYAERVRLAAMPTCALADPVPKNCLDTRTTLPARNDRAAQTLSVKADLAEANAFAVISAVGGDTGTFAASTLSIAGSWQVAPGSGEFSYSYPIDVPAPAGGSAPSVGLSYSSGAVDGLTIGTNTQAGPNGLGWGDFANAFIERRYEPCIDVLKTTDLCWKSDNATISLAGLSGPLIPANAEHSEWRAQSDPGWRIQRLTGAPYTDIYQLQYWKVTGPDGTEYYFGYGHMPGSQTNSILGVSVIADNPGEPCRAPGDQLASCQQGWRWYLDRVVDPDGNVTSMLYDRQTNWYAGILGFAGHIGNTRYHPSAMLTHIFYGGRGWDASQYSGHVEFGVEWRCYYLVVQCPPVTPQHTGFPDVPTDLICGEGAPCTVYAPAFYNAQRYSYVRTQVRVGNEWRNVSQYNLIHSFNPNSFGVAEKLQLERVVHATIAFGKLNAYPPTVFGHSYLDNRVDHDSYIPKAMRHNRITRITNPLGGVTTVTYNLNRWCDGGYALAPPPHWDRNVRDCFPQSIKDGNFTRTGVFYKWLVTSVVESPGQGSPDMTTTYQYEGDPAWAFDTTAFARDEDELGWSVWRGYGTVTITSGVSKTRLRLFRGWHNDWVLKQDGSGGFVPVRERQVAVSTFDGAASYVDYPALAGRTLEEQKLGTLGGVADSPMELRRHEYERRVTFDPGPDFLFKAEWVGVSATTERLYSTPTAFRQRRSQTTYTPTLQPAKTLEEGWLDVTGDERCTITEYADNPTAAMFAYPAVNTKVAGQCTSGQILGRTETHYDGGGLGAAPTRGNATRQRSLVENGRWSETTTEYDELGRPVRVTDPAGAATTTVYEVTAGAWTGQIPIRTTVTNPLGHQTVTDFLPEFAVPKRIQDPNGNVTENSYDEFGRLTAIWLPTEPLAFAYPSYAFSYDIDNRAVRSQRLTSDSRCCETAVFEESWVVYDGFWRERQTQGLSSVSGKVLVSEKTYDNRGQVSEETVEQAVDGTPGHYLGAVPWLNRTRHAYDELGRETATQWLRGNTVARASSTLYGLDNVTVTGPDGRRVRERLDGLGRTTAVDEFDGQAWVSSTYRYDLADRLLSVTDPAGNHIDYTVNLAGWRTAQQDPNRGNASFAYDNAGRQTAAVDARGNQLVTVYDKLGRQVERRTGSVTGPLLAEWRYDTAAGGKGKLHKEITHTPSGDWVSEVTGYDAKGRAGASRMVVPAGLPGLSGTYSFDQTYDRADRVRTMSLPAIGGLPAEQLSFDYDRLGLPTRMLGTEEYVWGAAYDDRGRRTSIGIGPRPAGATWMGRNWSYDADQRLSGVETFINGRGVVSDHEYSYDQAGNLKEKLTRLSGLAWRECFSNDQRGRLTAAHTVAASATCAAGTPNTGDRPYISGYEYSPDNRMSARIDNGVRTAYTYPAAGGAKPHAPNRIGATTYAWDGTGNLASRTTAGQTETFAWTSENRLASVTGPGGATTFVYDSAGQRLLRKTPDARTTLYLAGHEITVNGNGNVVSAVRPYTFDGVLVATRSLTGVDYLVSDAAGSVEMSTPSGGSPTATHSYTPFGKTRGEDGDFDTERGFVGQIEDSTTGLSYLNARYYDPGSGIFISTDPVYDTSKPKTLNPYAYSMNNPTTLADPAGTYSTYTFGLERENAQLRDQNKELIAYIGTLNQHIEELQDIIRKQHSDIKKLLSHIGALEVEIARQAGIIRQLQNRVAHLQKAVWQQSITIGKLWKVINVQAAELKSRAREMKVLEGRNRRLGASLTVYAAAAVVNRTVSAMKGALAVVSAAVRAAAIRSAFADDDDDCGWGWSGVANCLQRGGHVVRFVYNLPYTTPSVGWAYATGGGCRMSSGLMVRCSGMWEWADGWDGSGFTLGNAYMTSDSAECAEKYMEHESSHATQNALMGPAYPAFYGLDLALHGFEAKGTWMEDWAGLEKGGYNVDGGLC